MEKIRKYGKPPYRILLVHGGPGAAGDMEFVAKKLQYRHSVLEPFQTRKSINQLIQELNRQISEHAKQPLTLIGHSWGAWLVYLFASNYPGIVSKLILISAGAFEERYNSELISKRFDRLDEDLREEVYDISHQLQNESSFDTAPLKRFGKIMQIADSYELETYEESQVSFDVEIYNSIWKEADKMRKNGKLLEAASKIKCPVVAIHGIQDPHPIEGVEIPLGKILPNFKMISLDRCGHYPWFEKYAKKEFFKILEKEIEESYQ